MTPKPLTPELQAAIVECIRLGNRSDTAAEANGISGSLLREWLAAGRKGDERYISLVAAVTRARADAETYAVGALRSGFENDPKFAVEWLKRARHRTWDPEKRVQQTTTLKLEKMSDAELAKAMQDELAKMGGK